MYPLRAGEGRADLRRAASMPVREDALDRREVALRQRAQIVVCDRLSTRRTCQDPCPDRAAGDHEAAATTIPITAARLTLPR